MNNFIKLLPWLCCLGWVHAETPETALQTAPLAAPRKVQAADFVRSKIGPSQDLQLSIAGFDSSDAAPCPNPEFFIPGQLSVVRGFVRLGLRCPKPSAWVIYGSSSITEAQTVYKLKTDLAAGHLITSEDLTAAKVFLKIPTAGLNPESAPFVGRTLATALAAGTTLQLSHTKTSWVIKGGQTVTVYSQGTAFRISLEAQAIGNAVAGQVVQVRTTSGKMLTGQVLPDGAVELSR
jgi:flagella basal body P-ring formation protein FlgA